MNVPMLNYAQMPVVQLPSEMQGFSNALLQAGALRQDRLKAEQARADQLAQQQFQNNLATQQMGLQQKADVRADQALGMQQERHVADMATVQAQAIQRQKDEATKQWLSMPENAKRYADLEAKGDELGKLAFLEEGFMATGNFDGDKLMKIGDQKLRVMNALDAQETNELQRAKYRLDMAYTQLQMVGERMRQAAPQGGLDPKVAGQLSDNILAQRAQAISLLQKAKANVFTLGKVISATPTLEGLKSVQATLDPDSQEWAKVQKIMALAAGKPTPEAQARFISDELAQLNKLRVDQEKEINYLETKAMPAFDAQLGIAQRSMVGGDPRFGAVPLVEPQMQPPPPPERSWIDYAADVIFGSPDTGNGYIPRSQRNRETPPATTFKAKDDAMNLPTSDGPRPSKATLEGRLSGMMGAQTQSARDTEIADLEAQIRRAESIANTPLDFSDPIMGPLNREAMFQNKALADRLRKELEELRKKPVKSSTYKELRGREPFTGTY